VPGFIIRCLGYFLVIFITFVNCAAPVRTVGPAAQKKTSAPVENKTIVDKESAERYFIMARDYERRGIIDMAEHYYELAYNFDSNSELLKDELVRRYIESEKTSKALILIKGQRTNQELSPKEKRQVVSIYVKMGEFEKAAEVLELIEDRNDEEVYTLGLIYESMGKKDEALKNYLHYYRKNPSSVQIGYKIGKLLIASKRFTEAESLYTSMISGSGPKPDIFVMLGGLKVVQKDTAEGLRFFKKALEMDSLNEDALRSAAQIYLTRNDYPNAIVNYEKLYNENELGEVYGRTLAIIYFYNKQLDKAESLLSELLKDGMDDYELHYYLGLVFMGQKKNDLAMIEFEKTLSIRNTFDDAWKEMCYLAIRDKKYDEALQVAIRYQKIVSDKSAPLKLLGHVYMVRKEYTNAIESFQNALVIDSTDLYSYFELGSAFERTKKYSEAAEAFGRVLAAKPDESATCNYLGYMWAERGENLDSAKILILKALKDDPENGAFLDSYAWVLFQMGSIDSAFVYIEKAVKKVGDDPVVYFHLGEILLKKKEYTKAIAAFRKSLELEPDDPDSIRKKILDTEPLIIKSGSQKK
jgi:tetratricopeptide (TPR) repeat protein